MESRNIAVSSTSVLIQIPDPVYAALLDRAALSRRTLQEELQHVLSVVIASESELPPALAQELSYLSSLDDVALWEAARTQVPEAAAERLADLNFQEIAGELSEDERREQSAILREADRVILLRAHSAALLKQRGHDVSSLVRP
jgi:hypothetical protein